MSPEIIRWVRIIVLKLVREKRLGHLDTETLIAAGNLGYSQARVRFDEDRGVKFKTFAEYRIRGAVLDEVRKMIGDERCKNKKPKQVDHDLSREGDNAKYQMSMESHYDIKYFFSSMPLTVRDKEILRCRVEGQNLREIGEHFGFSESRASQVLAHIKREIYPWFQEYLQTKFKIIERQCPECGYKIETAEFSSRFDCESCNTGIKIENGEVKIDEEYQ